MKIQVIKSKISSCFSKQQKLCILAALIMTVLAYVLSGRNSILQEGQSIARGSPGSTDMQYELTVDSEEGSTRKLKVNVSAREYTEAEAQEAFEALMENMSVYICGENENLKEIRHDLKLSRSFPGYDGIKASWYSADPKLITDSGSIDNYGLSEPCDTELTVVLRAGSCRAQYNLPVTVYPLDAGKADDTELAACMDRAIADADSEQINDEYLVLPESLAGRAVRYSEQRDNGWMKIPALGIAAVVLLGLKPEQDRRRALKQREKEFLADYSDIVSKLAIYTGAGLTVSGAWMLIADNYVRTAQQYDTENPKRKSSAAKRTAYEEMLKTANELRQGVSEGRAYADFAERCSLSCYLRLISLLEQNRKNGDARLRQALLAEAREAFDIRKNTARQLGEEAGTKLMLPLMISLISVMMMIAVPAMLTLL